MNVIKAEVSCDLSESAFEQAVGLVRCEPDSAVIHCSHDSACVAFLLQKKYGCRYIFVPRELMVNKFHWSVTGPDTMFWSPGV